MEKEYIVKILDIKNVTHDVKRIRVEKPKDYEFIPGHATEVSVNKKGVRDKKSPFTFTSLTEKDYLEFTIKIYPENKGVTEQIDKLSNGEELIIRDSWGTIDYRGEGVFIAGGAGITPFIAMLRQLYKDGKIENNKLIFANKTEEDIIYKEELKEMLGNNCIFILSSEKKEGYDYGRIDENYLKEKIKDFNTNFYVCGPPIMNLQVRQTLEKLGARPESVVFEK